MREPRVKDQLRAIRQLWRETTKGEAQWSPTGSEDSYKSIRRDEIAILERTEEGFVRLKFSTRGREDYTVQLEELPSYAQASQDEEDRDAWLSKLWLEVTRDIDRSANAMDRFLGMDNPPAP